MAVAHFQVFVFSFVHLSSSPFVPAAMESNKAFAAARRAGAKDAASVMGRGGQGLRAKGKVPPRARARGGKGGCRHRVKVVHWGKGGYCLGERN